VVAGLTTGKGAEIDVDMGEDSPREVTITVFVTMTVVKRVAMVVTTVVEVFVV
jgi:hypothetical protein